MADRKLLKAKIIINKKGFFEFGDTDNWILGMDDKREVDEITYAEKANYEESKKLRNKEKKTPDGVGSAPGSDMESGELPVGSSEDLDAMM